MTTRISSLVCLVSCALVGCSSPPSAVSARGSAPLAPTQRELRQGAEWICYHKQQHGKEARTRYVWEKIHFRVLVAPDNGSTNEFVIQIAQFRPDLRLNRNPAQRVYIPYGDENDPFRLILNPDRTFKAVEFSRNGRWARFAMKHPQWVEELFTDRVFSIPYPDEAGDDDFSPLLQ